MRMEQIIGFGILLIILGFTIVFFGILKSTKEGNSQTKVAVGGFIGFIPFGFGNDKNMVWFITIISIVLFVIWLFIGFRIRSG